MGFLSCYAIPVENSTPSPKESLPPLPQADQDSTKVPEPVAEPAVEPAPQPTPVPVTTPQAPAPTTEPSVTPTPNAGMISTEQLPPTKSPEGGVAVPAKAGFHFTKPTRFGDGILYALLILVVVLIVAALGFLYYVENSPNSAKAFAAARSTLADVTTMKFSLDYNMDVVLAPSSADRAKGATDRTGVIVFSGGGSLDKKSRKLEITGTLDVLGEKQEFHEVIVANSVYIKYSDKNTYVQTSDLTKAVVAYSYLDSLNWFPNLPESINFGYGGEDQVTGEVAYRFRPYPEDSFNKEFVTSQLQYIVNTLIKVNIPTVTSAQVTFGDLAYRLWVLKSDAYTPKRVEIKLDTAAVSLGASGSLSVSNMTTTLNFLEVNNQVNIQTPTL